MDEIHVAIKAEQLTEWMGIPITNTLLMSWVVMAVLLLLALFVRSRLVLAPSKLQLTFEILVSGVLDFIADTLESRELAKKFFPLIVTVFIFIFAGNMLEFIPGVGSIGFIAQHTAALTGGPTQEEFVPLLRSMNTDLNVTLALSIIVFLVIEISGVAVIGFFKYFHRFFPFGAFSHGIGHGLIMFFVGIIELVSEVIRLISFSFRLFGNIFAGEVLIAVATFFVPVFIPVPFIAFEVFVGFIQAAIFSLLTLFFLKLAVAETAH